MTARQDSGDVVRERPVAWVIGAGVAGLTAAHELALRGLEVHVVEAEQDERGGVGPTPAIGGMARTQFYWAKDTRSGSMAPLTPGTGPTIGTVRLQSVDPGRDYEAVSTGIELGKVPQAYLLFRLSRGGDATESHWTAGALDKSGMSCGLTVGLDDAQNEFFHKHGPRSGAWNARRFRALVLVRDEVAVRDVSARIRAAVNALPDAIVEAQPGELPAGGGGPSARARLEKCLDWIDESARVQCDGGGGYAKRLPAGVVAEVWALSRDEERDPSDVQFRECAGEHGYRLFPSFYSHVYDTMRRTPLLPRGVTEVGPDSASDFGTVIDNLVNLEQFALGLPDGMPPELIPRRRVSSLRELLRLQRVLQGRLGFELRDMLRYQVRMLLYMSSCDDRRKQYEDITWNDFLALDDDWGACAKDALDGWAKGLVGLRGAEADARTFGSVATQQMLDTLTTRTMRDATLNGPTSDAWFDPWRRHLQKQLGVRFHVGTCVALEVDPSGGAASSAIQADGAIRAVIRGPSADSWPEAWAGGGADPTESSHGEWRTSRSHYHVLAVNPTEAYRLFKTLECSVMEPDVVAPEVKRAWDRSATSGWFAGISAMLETKSGGTFAPSELLNHTPDVPSLRHLFGLQYFFLDRDLPFTYGHVFMPEHPYGISAISQQQFRVRRGALRWTAGTLSVDIGAPDAIANERGAAGADGKRLWELSNTDVAREVWTHVVRCFVAPDAAQQHLADNSCLLYNFDRGIQFVDLKKAPPWLTGSAPKLPWGAAEGDREAARVQWDAYYRTTWTVPAAEVPPGEKPGWDPSWSRYNNTPYVVTPPHAYRRWAGRLDPDDLTVGYEVEFGNLTCCGSYTRTFTRLVTMESSNESARHAVNGILHDFDRRRGIVRPGPTGGAWASTLTSASRTFRSREMWSGAASDGTSAKPARSRWESIDRLRETGWRNPGKDEPWSPTGLCEIFPIEERELDTFVFWKQLDQALFDEGLPHLLDILQLDARIRDGMPTARSARKRPLRREVDRAAGTDTSVDPERETEAELERHADESLVDDIVEMFAGGVLNMQRMSRFASPFLMQMVQTFLRSAPR